jgi:hypothetical protein
MFDQALWRQFWFRNQKYQTICSLCSLKSEESGRKLDELKISTASTKHDDLNWGPVMLENASNAIISHWYQEAHDRIFGENGRERPHISLNISDDEEGDIPSQWSQNRTELTSKTSYIATLWLRTARARLHRYETIENHSYET